MSDMVLGEFIHVILAKKVWKWDFNLDYPYLIIANSGTGWEVPDINPATILRPANERRVNPTARYKSSRFGHLPIG